MVFRNLYEDIHVLVKNCQWKSSGDQHEREIPANWRLWFICISLCSI